MKWLVRIVILLVLFNASAYADAIYIKREKNGSISFSDQKEPGAIEDKLIPGMTLDEFLQRLSKLQREQAAKPEQTEDPDKKLTITPQTDSKEPEKIEEKPKPEEQPKSEPVAKTEPAKVETPAQPDKKPGEQPAEKQAAPEVTYSSFEIQENKANDNIFSYPNDTGFAVVAILKPALAQGDTVKLEYDGEAYDVVPGKEINLSKETSDAEYNKLIKEKPLLASAAFISQGKDTKIRITLQSMTMVNFPKGEHKWQLIVYRDGNQLISSNIWTTNNIYAELKHLIKKPNKAFIVVHAVVNLAKQLLAPI